MIKRKHKKSVKHIRDNSITTATNVKNKCVKSAAFKISRYDFD